MEFIQIAYCCTVPVFLLLSFLPGMISIGRISKNFLAVSNALLVLYAFFVLRQLIGVYQLGQTAKHNFHIEGPSIEGELLYFFIRQSVLITLGFCFVAKRARASRILPILILVLLYWDHPVSGWNTFALPVKIMEYACVFCSAYALLWLLHQLPDQSSTR